MISGGLVPAEGLKGLRTRLCPSRLGHPWLVEPELSASGEVHQHCAEAGVVARIGAFVRTGGVGIDADGLALDTEPAKGDGDCI